jgi:hypothetical protein
MKNCQEDAVMNGHEESDDAEKKSK